MMRSRRSWVVVGTTALLGVGPPAYAQANLEELNEPLPESDSSPFHPFRAVSGRVVGNFFTLNNGVGGGGVGFLMGEWGRTGIADNVEVSWFSAVGIEGVIIGDGRFTDDLHLTTFSLEPIGVALHLGDLFTLETALTANYTDGSGIQNGGISLGTKIIGQVHLVRGPGYKVSGLAGWNTRVFVDDPGGPLGDGGNVQSFIGGFMITFEDTKGASPFVSPYVYTPPPPGSWELSLFGGNAYFVTSPGADDASGSVQLGFRVVKNLFGPFAVTVSDTLTITTSDTSGTFVWNDITVGAEVAVWEDPCSGTTLKGGIDLGGRFGDVNPTPIVSPYGALIFRTGPKSDIRIEGGWIEELGDSTDGTALPFEIAGSGAVVTSFGHASILVIPHD